MKNIFFYLVLSCLSAVQSISGITYRQATEHDIPGILALMDQCSVEDQECIVFLPSCVRTESVISSVRSGRYFVAIDDSDKVIGYKKLFIITDKQELQEILNDEIRCLIKDTACYQEPAATAFLEVPVRVGEGTREINNSTHVFNFSTSDQTIFIYTGADYTVPEHRNKGINTALLRTGLELLVPELRLQVQEENSRAICLVYGLITRLSGERIIEGRTRSIAPVFAEVMHLLHAPVIESIALQNRTLLCARFPAYKPVFNQTGNALPDELSIPGFGYLLSYSLKHSSKEGR